MGLFDLVAKGGATLFWKLKEASPKLMIIGGGACMLGACVMAVRNSERAKTALEEGAERTRIARENLKDLKDPEKKEEMEDAGFTEEDLTKEIAQIQVETTVKVVKSYIPTALLFVGGMSLIAGSHYIMDRRLNESIAAYAVLDEAFKEYRKRWKEEVGEEKEKEVYHGVKEVKDEETGKTTKVLNEDKEYWEKSPYSRFFDETNPNWTPDAESNKFFLTAVQSQANDRFKARGFLFLNEVYDMLDMPWSSNGQLVGWLKGNGDDFVDFGLIDIYSQANRRFNNGYEPVVLLDFNVDGEIVTKLKNGSGFNPIKQEYDRYLNRFENARNKVRRVVRG